VGEGERDPSHFVPELSRRARGFATWAMLRHLGREGIAAMVSEHCRLARRMAERLTIEPGIKVLNEVALNQVIVRFGVSDDLDEGNRLTAQVIKTLQADGTLFLSGAEWHGE
jgi:glutamate/tyrosine decarboxylase-like PLP-dependent enzyme